MLHKQNIIIFKNNIYSNVNTGTCISVTKTISLEKLRAIDMFIFVDLCCQIKI